MLKTKEGYFCCEAEQFYKRIMVNKLFLLWQDTYPISSVFNNSDNSWKKGSLFWADGSFKLVVMPH